MAKKRANKKTKKVAVTEESIVDQMEIDTASAGILDQEVEIPDPDLAGAGPGEAFRPSDLDKLIANGDYTDFERNGQVDKFKLIREYGLPTPTRLYRVTGKRGTKEGPVNYGPAEAEAVDESEAVLKAADSLKISYRERHRVNFQVVVLEE